MGGVVLTGECPPVGPLLDDAERLVLEYELAAARQPLDAALAALGCDWASPADLGRYWLVEGVAAHLAEDPAAGAEAFAAAVRTGGATWNPDYGAKLEVAWTAAADPRPDGILEVSPAGARVTVDGRPWTGGALAVGLHLVQVGEARGAPVLSRIVRIPEGTAVSVEAPVAAPRARSRPDAELRLVAGGAAYGRFGAAGFGGLGFVGAAPVAGPVGLALGGHALLGRHETAGPRLLVVARGGVEVALAEEVLHAGIAGLYLPQDLGGTGGIAGTVGGTVPLGAVGLAWELAGGWTGGGLVLATVGVAR